MNLLTITTGVNLTTVLFTTATTRSGLYVPLRKISLSEKTERIASDVNKTVVIIILPVRS